MTWTATINKTGFWIKLISITSLRRDVFFYTSSQLSPRESIRNLRWYAVEHIFSMNKRIRSLYDGRKRRGIIFVQIEWVCSYVMHSRVIYAEKERRNSTWKTFSRIYPPKAVRGRRQCGYISLWWIETDEYVICECTVLFRRSMHVADSNWSDISCVGCGRRRMGDKVIWSWLSYALEISSISREHLVDRFKKFSD